MDRGQKNSSFLQEQAQTPKTSNKMVKLSTVASTIGIAVFGEREVLEKRRRGSRNLNPDAVLRELSSEFSTASSLDIELSASMHSTGTVTGSQDLSEGLDSDENELSESCRCDDEDDGDVDTRVIETSEPELDKDSHEKASSSRVVNVMFGDYESMRAMVAARFASSTPNSATITKKTTRASLRASTSSFSFDSLDFEDLVDDDCITNHENGSNPSAAPQEPQNVSSAQPRRASSRRLSSSRLSVSSISFNFSIAEVEEEEEGDMSSFHIRRKSLRSLNRRSKSFKSTGSRRSSRTFPRFDLDQLIPNLAQSSGTLSTTVETLGSSIHTAKR